MVETLMAGTRIAATLIRPERPGSTFVTWFAALVVVGTIDTAAARLRSKLAAGASTVGWLPV
jgi:hypothetical protein